MSADVADQAQATDADATVAVAPGRRLAEARAAMQMTVADVAQQLKLSVAQVEALEAGEHARLPGPVFVKGFVRNYARLVGVDVTQLLGALELPSPPSGADAVPPSQDVPFEPVSGFNWRPYLIGVLLLIGALGAYEMWRSGMLQPRPSADTASAPSQKDAQPAPSLNSAPAPSVASHQSVVTPGYSVVDAQPVSSPSPEKAEQTADVTPLIKPERSPAPEKTPERASAVAPADSGSVVLRFSALSWVEVRDRDDRVLLSQLNAPGSKKALSGPKPLRLVIGNANAVRMTVAGKPFDLTPHTSLNVAKVILE